MTPAESHAEVASPPAAVNAAAPSPIPPPPANTAPGLRSDRWAWVCLLVAVPSLLASLGGPLGEPVADDYDFLHHAAFAGRGRWLDGGGSLFYWRPLARQLYYRTLGGVMLSHPAWICMLHAGLAGVAALMLYQALRSRWPAAWAAAAATFPFLVESARMLLVWPSNLQDLGALVFAALAMREASRGRLLTALPALLASLLCKETGVVAALVLPWMPATRGRSRTRMHWIAATSGLVAVWGALYAHVLSAAGQRLARELFEDASVQATPWPTRYAWALVHSLRDALSLNGLPPPWSWALLAAVGFVAAGAAWGLASRPAARARLKPELGWVLWGAMWFMAATLMLAEVFPEWRSYRSVFALFGLGVAFLPVIAAVHPGLVGALVIVRLLGIAASPGAPAEVAQAPSSSAAGITYPELVRLQRVVGETRRTLLPAFPALPPHARVARHLMPRLALYAYGNDEALQTWYRDSTLSWMSFGEFLAQREARPVTIVEFQPRGGRQVALVNPAAMRAVVAASELIRRGDRSRALALLARADSLQADPAASAFFGIVAGLRAQALQGLGRETEAEREAERAIPLWPENNIPRRVLAELDARHARLEAAAAQLETLLAFSPQDSSARSMYRRIMIRRQRGAP